MKKFKIGVLLAAVLTLTAIALLQWSEVGIAKQNANSKLKVKLRKADIVDLIFVAYNNWNYTMTNQGSYFFDTGDEDRNGNRAGGEFPRGSTNTIVYAAGLYVGTLKNGTPVVSETEFSPEFQPGRITNSDVAFTALTAEDPAGASQRVYVIDRTRSGDYSSWPADAPKDDLGQPALIADAQTWTVFNDLDISLSQEGQTVSPDPGLGVQVVMESFVFNAGPLSDVVYCKFTITNKTNVDYESSYLGLWMDADVDPNYSTNDIVGVDTAKGLGFVYNINDDDDFDAAVGFDFLQGPVVKISEVSAALAAKFADNDTTLVYDPSRNIYVPTKLPADEIWLGATAFNTYANGTDPRNNGERYNLLAGRFADGNPKTGAGVSDYYAFRGNPLTAPPGDPNIHAIEGDQRILHCVGPFTIKAGSSQEVWAGVVGALGADRLNAVENMFKTDDLAQTTFEAGLVAPAPPEIPKITVIGLDGRVNITWQNNAEYSEDIAGEILGINEANGYEVDDTNSPDADHDGNPDGFTSYLKRDFQGYRVYKSRTGLPGSYQLLAQYDKVDNFQTVRNWRINAAGRLVVEDIIIGTNTGLRYSFEDTDVINGQRYFYSVTAFDAQPYISNTNNPFTDPDPTIGTINGPSGLPISLESAPTANVTSVVPMAAVLTTHFDASSDSAATHTAGVSDGSVIPVIINPEKVTGDDYRVEFFLLGSADGYPDETLAYRLINKSKNNVVVSFSSRVDDPNTPVDERTFATAISDGTENQNEFAVADGFILQVFGPPAVIKSAGYVDGPQYSALGDNSPGRWFDEINFGGSSARGGIDYSSNAFLGAGTTTVAADWKDINIVFTRDSTKWQWVYSGSGSAPTYSYMMKVPFQIFEVDPTDGDATPKQLGAFVMDQAGLHIWTPRADAGNAPTPAGPQSRSYIYIDKQAYDLPTPGGTYAPGALSPRSSASVNSSLIDVAFGYRDPSVNPDGHEWNEIVRRAVGAGSPDGATINYNERDSIYANIPDEGTYQIRVNHVLLPTDVYEFSTSANSVVTAKSTLKKSLKNVLVVPNPYYGRSEYQATLFDKVIKFTNLPGACTIRIFNVAGDLVSIINHNAGSDNDRVNTTPLDLTSSGANKETSVERWDLRNPGGKFVASGMYIALIEAPGIGKTTVKFAVIQEEIQINGPDVR